RGAGRDPDLPEGDVITAIAWTKSDGCIVTASDGAEPGRLVLWDADSFTLLRIIKTQYPRQPVSSSYSTLGFWDEYRSLFILLDVDELAEDAESGLSLQYIPSKAHTEPAPDGISRFALAHRSPFVLIASDDGTGYVMIDYRQKKPVAKIAMEVDSVRQVAISHDGKKIAIVPNDSKVIFILGLDMAEVMSPVNPGEERIGTFRHLGTVLGVDPADVSDTAAICCVFSRSGNTILTDGDFGSVKVWEVNELGDHSTLRFKTNLPNLAQGLAAISSSTTSTPIGWAVTEGLITVSLSDAKGRSRVRSHRMAVSFSVSKPTALKRDVIIGVSTHPSKPIIAVVTDLGNLCLLSADRLPDEPATWVGALWSTAFGKVKDDEKIMSFNVRQAGAQAGATCVSFLPVVGTQQAHPSPRRPSNANATREYVEVFSFATGHEDGSVAIWEWYANVDPLDLSPKLVLRLNAGRVTSLVPSNTGNHKMAFTIDDTAVLVWDGQTDDPDGVTVLIPPQDYNKEEENRNSVASAKHMIHRYSTASIRSVIGGVSWNLDRPCAVAFARTKENLLATGSNEGTITVWNTEAGVRRSLLTPSGLEIRPAPIMAIGWSVDDAALASISEDKRISIHNTVTGDLVWIHELWMIQEHLSVAVFSIGARHLATVDHTGEMTVLMLHGDWPTAANAAAAISGTNPPAGSTVLRGHPATRMSGTFPEPPEPEFVTLGEWDPSVSVKLVRRRTEKNARVAVLWEKTAGSGSRGHVALLKMSDGLPRGTYEVLCEFNIPADIDDSKLIGLKFVCGPESDDLDAAEEVHDPELDGIRGFSRLFPVEEQLELAGKGPTTVRLGYIKALCKLETCYVDLKRIPGDGEALDCGDVHFIPVDPRLYTPDYEPPQHLADAYDRLMHDFENFEQVRLRHGQSINLAALEGMTDADFPDMPRSGLPSPNGQVTVDIDAAGETMWEAHEHDGVVNGSTPISPLSNTSALAEATKGSKRVSNRMSMLPSALTGVVGGVVGGIIGAVAAKPATKANMSFEDIQKEMEEARKKAREEAKRFEEEEERKAAEEARARAKLAREVAAEKAEQERLKEMSRQLLTRGPGEGAFDGDEDELMAEAKRMMAELEATSRRVEEADRIASQRASLQVDESMNESLRETLSNGESPVKGSPLRNEVDVAENRLSQGTVDRHLQMSYDIENKTRAEFPDSPIKRSPLRNEIHDNRLSQGTVDRHLQMSYDIEEQTRAEFPDSPVKRSPLRNEIQDNRLSQGTVDRHLQLSYDIEEQTRAEFPDSPVKRSPLRNEIQDNRLSQGTVDRHLQMSYDIENQTRAEFPDSPVKRSPLRNELNDNRLSQGTVDRHLQMSYDIENETRAAYPESPIKSPLRNELHDVNNNRLSQGTVDRHLQMSYDIENQTRAEFPDSPVKKSPLRNELQDNRLSQGTVDRHLAMSYQIEEQTRAEFPESPIKKSPLRIELDENRLSQGTVDKHLQMSYDIENKTRAEFPDSPVKSPLRNVIDGDDGVGNVNRLSQGTVDRHLQMSFEIEERTREEFPDSPVKE
ncbi:hypothetical protein HDU76_009314, partial [Blyttiomyces sp. JEL0837]